MNGGGKESDLEIREGVDKLIKAGEKTRRKLGATLLKPPPSPSESIFGIL